MSSKNAGQALPSTSRCLRQKVDAHRVIQIVGTELKCTDPAHGNEWVQLARITLNKANLIALPFTQCAANRIQVISQFPCGSENLALCCRAEHGPQSFIEHKGHRRARNTSGLCYFDARRSVHRMRVCFRFHGNFDYSTDGKNIQSLRTSVNTRLCGVSCGSPHNDRAQLLTFRLTRVKIFLKCATLCIHFWSFH